MYWPPRACTAFCATETQGTSSAASSALVISPSRVILGLRQGLVLTQLSERSMSSLQCGFVAYVRHDWAFAYSAQAVRVRGILTIDLPSLTERPSPLRVAAVCRLSGWLRCRCYPTGSTSAAASSA